jgi:beta-phosphoglucomutase-like phosphatase (HAD superfamily)
MCFQQTSYMQALDVLVTFDDISHPKPAPVRDLLACQKLSVAPNRELVFEDSNIGIKTSLAAGCQTVAIPDILEIEPTLLALPFTGFLVLMRYIHYWYNLMFLFR